MRRRSLVWLSTAVPVAALVAACGSAEPPGASGDTDNGSGQGGGDLTAAEFCADEEADPAGGPPEPNPDIEGTVEIWGWYNEAPLATVEAFQQLYPNIEVKPVDYSLDDTPTQLATAINAGTGVPDLAMVEDLRLPGFWDAGLLDLSECLEPYKDDFPEFKWDRIQRPDGSIVSVPWEINPGMVTYNRGVFDQYGIDAESIETWDDYIAAGQKIRDESGGEVKLLLSNVAPTGSGLAAELTNDLVLLTNQQGGRYFTEDGEVAVDSKETINALNLLKSFRDEDLTLNDVSSAQAELDALRTGRVASFIGEASSRFFLSGQLPDTAGDWGVIQLPAFTDGGTRGAVNGGTSIVIPEQSDNAEAAWEFAKFWLLTVEGRHDSFVAGQLVENVYQPAAEDERFQQPDPFYGGDNFLQIALASAEAAPPAPSAANFHILNDALQNELRGFMAGDTSAEEVVETAARAAESGY